MYLETPTSHHATTKAYLSRIVKDNWDCNQPKHMNRKKIKGTTDTDIAFMLTNSKVTFTQNMLWTSRPRLPSVILHRTTLNGRGVTTVEFSVVPCFSYFWESVSSWSICPLFALSVASACFKFAWTTMLQKTLVTLHSCGQTLRWHSHRTCCEPHGRDCPVWSCTERPSTAEVLPQLSSQ